MRFDEFLASVQRHAESHGIPWVDSGIKQV
jgi:hypothetical protein